MTVTKIEPTYDFLFVYKSNYVPNLHSFHVTATFKCPNGHLTFTFVLKVKFKVTKMTPIYDFLFIYNSNYVPKLHSFHVIGPFRSQNDHLTLALVLKVKLKVTKMNPIYVMTTFRSQNGHLTLTFVLKVKLKVNTIGLIGSQEKSFKGKSSCQKGPKRARALHLYIL